MSYLRFDGVKGCLHLYYDDVNQYLHLYDVKESHHLYDAEYLYPNYSTQFVALNHVNQILRFEDLIQQSLHSDCVNESRIEDYRYIRYCFLLIFRVSMLLKLWLLSPSGASYWNAVDLAT
uniref:Uncharacterized protein n=1 Tax=Cacopsylla melanoneura TaxID=428564 RepID=A0A8D8QI96_9HEMI